MISVERVHALHLSLVQLTNEPSGVLHPGCVESAVGAAGQACVYLGDDPVVFAACLLFYLVKGHCYEQGNKRTAWSSAIDVLHTVKLQVEATDEEVEVFVSGVASRKESISWFQQLGRIIALDVVRLRGQLA